MNIFIKYKQLILGIIVGTVFALPSYSFANDTIQNKVEAMFSKFNIIVNGETKVLDADPLVVNGSTYVPLRVMSNMLGYDVTYKADSRTILLDNDQGSNTSDVNKDKPTTNNTNEKDDNLVSESNNDQQITKYFVSFLDIYQFFKNNYNDLQTDIVMDLSNEDRIITLATVENEKPSIKKFEAKRNIDVVYYKDINREDADQYFSLEFLSQFLSSSQINNLNKSEITVTN